MISVLRERTAVFSPQSSGAEKEKEKETETAAAKETATPSGKRLFIMAAVSSRPT
jgi:hypothetical protein